jgi:LmbE family N-acetylglucosaminyl deacetylase
VREKELEQSCKFLDFDESPIVIDDPDLPDGMLSKWPKELVSSQIEKVLRSMSANG